MLREFDNANQAQLNRQKNIASGRKRERASPTATEQGAEFVLEILVRSRQK